MLELTDFNPRPHAGDDFLTWLSCRRTTKFQSTSPRGGRRQPDADHKHSKKFQSTSPRGGRRRPGRSRTAQSYFNPRPHAGDDNNGLLHGPGQHISIHVPTRGTTAKTAKIYSIYHNIFSHSYNKTKSIPQISNPTPQSHHKTPQNSGADPPAFLCSLPIRTT